MSESVETQLRALIVESLALDDVTPEEIDPDAPLFSTGLGLDSIDAIELSAAIDRTFGVKLSANDTDTRDAFRSLRSLSALVAKRMTTGVP